jgi:predicted dehydrogenase
MNDKIKIGLIGAGHLGKMHIKNLLEISREDADVEFAGIYDVNTEHAYEISSEMKVKSFGSLDEYFDNINTTLIVTPTLTHFEIAKLAIEKGKNIFVEKPVTATLAEAKQLRDVLGTKDIIFQVGHIERFNPALLALKDIDIKPLFIECHRLAQFNPRGTDVSVVQDLMIHDIDLILSLVKSKVKSIDASGVPIITQKIDISNARIKFDNGCVANITSSRISQKRMRKMRIFQKSAYISIDFQENESEIFNLVPKEDKRLKKFNSITMPDSDLAILYEKNKGKEKNPMKIEQKHFIDCIKNSRQPLVTLEDGLQALEVAREIILKSEESTKEMQ